MTGTEMINRAFASTGSLITQDLAVFEVNDLSTMTEPQQLFYLNWATREFARRAERWNPKIVFTIVAGTDIYLLRNTATFAKRMVQVDGVVINGLPLCAPDGREGMWSYPYFKSQFPKWRADAQSTPKRAMLMPSDSLLLNPPPTQAVIDAGNNYVSGTVLPDIVTHATIGNQVDIEEDLHEYVPYLMVVAASIGTADEALAWQRMSAMRGEVESVLAEVKRRNANLRTAFDMPSNEGFGQEDILCM